MLRVADGDRDARGPDPDRLPPVPSVPLRARARKKIPSSHTDRNVLPGTHENIEPYKTLKTEEKPPYHGVPKTRKTRKEKGKRREEGKRGREIEVPYYLPTPTLLARHLHGYKNLGIPHRHRRLARERERVLTTRKGERDERRETHS